MRNKNISSVVDLCAGECEKAKLNKVSIAWTNLRYQVCEFNEWRVQKKVILRQLNGYFCAGTLNNLMGPSGSGKTSLLNCLSGTVKLGLSGDSEIYLDKSDSKPVVSYYIKQHVHESIIGELTVGQILRYAFAFKNGTASSESISRNVAATMEALSLPLELESRRFARCSGGEQKRVAIAQELMALNAPTFLFIDEPSTGLDSNSAFEVMLCLQKLAQSQHITVVASIHAPNDDTLNLFDKLYVLAKGGICIYSGPPSQIKAHLKHEINCAISEHQPPIEALLKIACNGSRDSNVLLLAKEHQTSIQKDLNHQLTALALQPNGMPTPRKFFSFQDFCTHLLRMFRITFITNIKPLLFTAILFFVFFALLSTIYSPNKAAPSGCYTFDFANASCNNEDKLKNDDLVRENGHYLSYVLLVLGIVIMISSQVFYSTHAKVFQCEHRNHWYSVGVFYWSSKIISFLEMNFLAVVITIFTYFLSNQHAADNGTINWTRLAYYFLFIWLMCLYYQTFGHLIGIALVNHPQLALILGQLLYTTTTLINGLYIKPNRMEIYSLELISDWMGMVGMTRLMYYAIYGIDRCVPEKEYSWVLLDYNVEVNKIGEYISKVLVNVAIIKLVTLAVMLWKFNTFNIAKCNTNQKAEDDKLCIDVKLPSIETRNEENNGKTVKDDEEVVAFKQFSNDKLLIAWKNLSLFSRNSLLEVGAKNDERRPILRNLNGQFRFGTLNGLMGTSGSGKTSCLKVLNGQCKTRLSEETEIYLTKFTTIRTCFITQEVSGHLMPGLTAKQTLIYASKLKNMGKDVNHEQIALKWLQELDLMNTVETKVEKCSGGERKRLAVALELTSLVMPNLICIDEPTSGLDTNSAEIVISTLHKLTQSHPLTIVTSIHQPTTEVLYMFDQLYVLARGGVCIYSGPPNHIKAHLNSITDISESSIQFPIQTLIKYSCLGNQADTVQKLVQLTDKQHFAPDGRELLEQTQLASDGVVSNRARFSLQSFLALSQRFLLYIRGYLWKEWLFFIINAIGFALSLRLFFNPKIIYPSGCISPSEDDLLNSCSKSVNETENEFLLTDNMRYNFFYVSIYLLIVMLTSSINFSNEFPYLLNEHRNGWYSTSCFYLMKSLYEILPIIPANLVYVYIIDIYDPVVHSAMYWPLVFLITLAAIGFMGFAHLFSLLSGGNLTNQTILIVAGTYVLLQVISNFYIPVATLPYLWNFLSNFNICRFTFENVMLLQYGFGRCRPKEIAAVLFSMSIEDSDYGFNIVMLIFNLILYRIIAIYLLVRKVNPVENRRKRVMRIAKYTEHLQMNTGAADLI